MLDGDDNAIIIPKGYGVQPYVFTNISNRGLFSIGLNITNLQYIYRYLFLVSKYFPVAVSAAAVRKASG